MQVALVYVSTNTDHIENFKKRRMSNFVRGTQDIKEICLAAAIVNLYATTFCRVRIFFQRLVNVQVTLWVESFPLTTAV